jgi:prephenate dehydrogenase
MSRGDLPGAVAVVGLGLIGASLCRALRLRLPQVRVIGVARRAETAERAIAEGVCHVAGTDPALLGGAEVVVLSTPVDAMPDWLRACAEQAPEALVTDCGSSKAWVVTQASAILGNGRFLGGHPMAGKELSGYDAADEGLFDGCVWVLTPRQGSDLDAFAPWIAVIAALGAHLEVADPETPDRAVAWISHLPFALSAALVRSATADASWPEAQRLAASGFRDMARLAGGDPMMYSAISATNAPAMLVALDAYRAELERLAAVLGDAEASATYFDQARELRRTWLAERARAGRSL